MNRILGLLFGLALIVAVAYLSAFHISVALVTGQLSSFLELLLYGLIVLGIFGVILDQTGNR